MSEAKSLDEAIRLAVFRAHQSGKPEVIMYKREILLVNPKHTIEQTVAHYRREVSVARQIEEAKAE